MKALTYSIDFNSQRNPSGRYEEPTNFFIGFDTCFQRGNCRTNGVSIDNPVFMAIDDQGRKWGDADSAADLLDDFLSLEYDIAISFDPTPESGRPRLTILALATPERIYIY